MAGDRLGGTHSAPAGRGPAGSRPAGSRPAVSSLVRSAFVPGAGERPDLPRHRRAVAGRSMVAVGILAGLAAISLLIPQPWVAAALLGALGASLLWISARMHRNPLAIGAAIGWWAVTAPAIGALSALGTLAGIGAPVDPWLRFTQSTSCVFLVGAVVWTLAVLLSRGPWQTITVCWLINLLVAGCLGVLLPGWALLTSCVVVAAYLAWRAGAIATLIADTKERTRVSRLYDQSTGEQRVIVDRLTELPRQATVVHRVTVPQDFGARLDFDAYVVSPTGTYGVLSCDAIGRLRLNLAANRRVSVEGRSLDDLLLDVAVSACAASDALRVQVVPLVAMVGASFPADYPGVVPATVAPREVDAPVDVVMLDPDLLVDRILHGETVYTSNQLMMIAQRIRGVLRPVEQVGRSPLGLPLERPASAVPSGAPVAGAPISGAPGSGAPAAGAPVSGAVAGAAFASGGQPAPRQGAPAGGAASSGGAPAVPPAAVPPGGQPGVGQPAPTYAGSYGWAADGAGAPSYSAAANAAPPPAQARPPAAAAPPEQRQAWPAADPSWRTDSNTGWTPPGTGPGSGAGGPGQPPNAGQTSYPSHAQPPSNQPAYPATPAPAEAMTAGGDQTERVLGPGVEVMWFDSVGAWSGWVCVTGIVRLQQIPYGITGAGLTVGDEVVWVVAKTEWQRAVAERRAVNPALAQPVRAQTLHIV